MVLNPVNEDYEEYYSSLREELLGESTQLDEMSLSEAPGFGNDKYWVITKDPDHIPLHAYVYRVEDNEELGDFLVTDKLPKKIAELETYRKEIPEDAKQMIVNQAGKRSTILPEVNNWKLLTAMCKTRLQKRFRTD